MLTVHTTTNPKHVALLEMALRDAGAEYRLDNANSAFLSEVGLLYANPIGFLVRDEDAVEAKRVIDDALYLMGEGPNRRPSNK